MKDDLLALLEDGPHALETLAGWIGAPETDVDAALNELHRDGLAKRFGPARGWVLMTYLPLRELHTGPALRQPAAPTSITAADRNASWWLMLPRDGFTSRAIEHETRMRTTKEHFQIPLRLLQ